MISTVVIEACARAAHEANRAYCIAIGDHSQSPWEHAQQWQKDSAVEGVRKALAGEGPEQLHESWCAHKRADGWVYGAIKDAAAKTHPCLVSYADLPAEQRKKDDVFLAVVRAVGAALQ